MPHFPPTSRDRIRKINLLYHTKTHFVDGHTFGIVPTRKTVLVKLTILVMHAFVEKRSFVTLKYIKKGNMLMAISDDAYKLKSTKLYARYFPSLPC